jgi:hypothetical protein
MLWRLFLWWCYECQRRWDMNLMSALARVEFESAVDMSNTTAKMICITLTTSRIWRTI